MNINSKVKSLLKNIEKIELPRTNEELRQVNIFSALVEAEFENCNDADKLDILESVGVTLDRTGIAGNFYPKYYKWKGKDYSGIVQIISAALNINEYYAIYFTGGLFGLKLENCFKVFKVKNENKLLLPPRSRVREDIHKKLILDGKDFYLNDPIEYIQDFAGNNEQGLCHYVASDKEDFFLLANRVERNGHPTLKIGVSEAPSYLLSRLAMSNGAGEKKPILLCQDINICSYIRKIISEVKLLDKEIHISGYYGGHDALHALEWTPALGHLIVIIPPTTAEGLINAHEWAKHCEKFCKDVKIYPWQLVVKGKNDTKNIEALHASLQKELLRKAIHADADIPPSIWIKKICSESLCLADYQNWLEKFNLRKPSNRPAEAEVNQVSKMRSLADIPDNFVLDKADATISSMFSSNYNTIIWGYSNVGKSWVAIEIVVALATHTDAFFLSADLPTPSNRKICYLDGEIGGSGLKTRCEQLLQSRTATMSDIQDNIKIITKDENIDIVDKKWTQWFLAELQKCGVDVVVIDNILALAPNATKSNATPLFDFVRELNKCCITVIMLHHAGKDAKDVKGPVDLISLCQNVIHLEGKAQLALGKELSPALSSALGKDGPVTKITIEKCKIPHFESKSATYHLPVGGVWEWVEGNLDCSPTMSVGSTEVPTVTAFSIVETPSLTPAQEVELSPRDEAILKHIRQNKCTRLKLQKKFDIKERTAGKILKQLVDMGFIERKGNAKNTYYQAK